jgi:sirohydrochlorin ferrochelatase
MRDRLRGPYCLSRVDHVRKIRDRKQTTNIRKYSFVNRTIKNWKQLAAEALGTFPSKTKIFRNRVRKAIINGVK